MKLLKKSWALILMGVMVVLFMLTGCASTTYMGDPKPVTRTECEIKWRLANDTYVGSLPAECASLPETLW